MVGAVVGVLPLWWFIPERFARLGSAYVSCDRLTVTFKGNIAAATLWPLVTGLLTMALAPSTQKTAKNLQIGAAGPSCGRVGEFRRLKDKETDMKIRSAETQNSGAVLLAFALLLVAGCSSSGSDSGAPPPPPPPVDPLIAELDAIGISLNEYCAVAEEWYVGATPGPVSVDPADIEYYIHRTNMYMQELASFDTSVADSWAVYATAYQEFRDHQEAAAWAWPTTFPWPVGIDISKGITENHVRTTCGLTILGSPAVDGAYSACYQRAVWLVMYLAETGVDVDALVDTLMGILEAHNDWATFDPELTAQLQTLIATVEELIGFSPGAPGDPGFDDCGSN